MSEEGLIKTAKIFQLMQTTRIELLGMGVKNKDTQDILLGQMLEDGKEAMKDKFLKLTLRKG